MSEQSTPDHTIRVMFVCLGNICRSPLAEALFRQKASEAGVLAYFDVRSSGTSDWHVGEPADQRMRETAQGRGVSLKTHRARQFEAGDLETFDHVFVMDKENLHDVLFFDRDERLGGKVRLFREADPQPDDYQVPDPYYGVGDGFDEVYDIVERTAEALVVHLVAEHGLRPQGRDAAR